MATTSGSDVRLEERDGFRFRGGDYAIDLPATLAGRLKPQPRERLNTPDDLARWLVAAGLADFRPDAGEADLKVAIGLREAIFVLAGAVADGRSPPGEALATLNAAAAGVPATPKREADGRVRLFGDAGAFLATLARHAVELFGGPQAGRIRQCASQTCTLFFVDTSRSGDRRWCSMSGCGNNAKVAEFRRRKRAAPEPS